jgi:hypothetical protein
VILVTVGRDLKVGVTPIEDAPQCAALTSGPPAGLVHVHRTGLTKPPQQIGVWLGQRLRGPAENRVHRARADPAGEQLLATLNDVAARDAVAHRKRRDGRLKTGAESALGDLARQLGSPAFAAARAVHPMTLMLGDLHRDRGQLLDLPAHRLARRDVLVHGEGVTAVTALGPVLDDPIDGPRRQQWPAPALMSRLGALGAPRGILATLRRAGGRIGARGNR